MCVFKAVNGTDTKVLASSCLTCLHCLRSGYGFLIPHLEWKLLEVPVGIPTPAGGLACDRPLVKAE